jgi:hypothetical protein
MNRASLQRQLQYRLDQFGSAGTLGLALLLLALLGWFTLVREGENELKKSAARLHALQQQIQLQSSLPVSSALNREEQLNVFYQGFQKSDAVPAALRGLYQAAHKQGLVLETGDYTWTHGATERLAHYRVALPLKGSFTQVLGFMDQVLQDNPRMALENASFKRDKVDDPQVDAKLVFVIFVDTQP